jgi:hypothetical protein
MKAVIDAMRERLAVLAPLALDIRDDSAKHAGHAARAAVAISICDSIARLPANALWSDIVWCMMPRPLMNAKYSYMMPKPGKT